MESFHLLWIISNKALGNYKQTSSFLITGDILYEKEMKLIFFSDTFPFEMSKKVHLPNVFIVCSGQPYRQTHPVLKRPVRNNAFFVIAAERLSEREWKM